MGDWRRGFDRAGCRVQPRRTTDETDFVKTKSKDSFWQAKAHYQVRSKYEPTTDQGRSFKDDLDSNQDHKGMKRRCLPKFCWASLEQEDFPFLPFSATSVANFLESVVFLSGGEVPRRRLRHQEKCFYSDGESPLSFSSAVGGTSGGCHALRGELIRHRSLEQKRRLVTPWIHTRGGLWNGLGGAWSLIRSWRWCD